MQRSMTESNYRPIFTSACIKTRHIVQAMGNYTVYI